MPLPPPNEKQVRLFWLSLTALSLGVLLAVIGGLVWSLGKLLQMLAPVLWPLAIAGAISYLLDPLVDFLEKKRVPRPRAILAVFALATLIVAAFFASVVPQVFRELKQLVEKVPAYTIKVQNQAQNWINQPPPFIRRFLHFPPVSPGQTNPPAPFQTVSEAPSTNTVAPTQGDVPGSGWSQVVDTKTLQSAVRTVADSLPKIGAWFFGQASRVVSWIGMLAGLALIPIYTFYFLLEKQGIQRKWTDYLPVSRSDFKDELVFVIRSINDYLIVFFRGQVLVALCDGVLYTIGFFLIGLPYAFLLGAMATVLTVIPFLGAIVTCAAALIIAFVQSDGWMMPLSVLAVFGVVQSLEGLFISPKIMGDRVGLHPLTIIVAVMVGTTVMGGLLGGILAIPLTAALRVVMFRYVWNRRDQSSPVRKKNGSSPTAA